MLQDELAFFVAHQDELVRKHRGKVLLLRNREVVGVFDTPLEAYLEAESRYEPGTYAIQKCMPGPEAHSETIASPPCVEAQMSEAGDLSDDPTLTGFIAVKIRSRVLATERIPRSAFTPRRRPIRLGLDDDDHRNHEA